MRGQTYVLNRSRGSRGFNFRFVGSGILGECSCVKGARGGMLKGEGRSITEWMLDILFVACNYDTSRQ